MKKITRKQLLEMLQSCKAADIVTVVMKTNVKLVKKSRVTKEPTPYKVAHKTTRCKAMLGTDYERGVNNQRCREDKEQSFEVQPHAWADRTDDRCVSTNKEGTQYYANLRVLDTYESVVVADGNHQMSKDELLEFGPAPKKKPENQGIEKPVIWNMPKVYPECSIQSITAHGETYVVEE